MPNNWEVDDIHELANDILLQSQGGDVSPDMSGYVGVYNTGIDSLAFASGNPIEIYSDINQIPEIKVVIVPKQSGSGDPSPTNIRPISGITQVDVTRMGKNKFNGASVTTTHTSNWGIDWNESTNTLTITHKASYTTGVPSLALDLEVGTYVVSFASQTKYESISIYTNGAYTKILRNGTTFSVESGNSYEIRFNADEGTPNVIKNFQIESGSTATTYEPYAGQSVTVNLGQTVYGGTLDVINGVLTVDRAMVDLGTLDWSMYTVAQGKLFRSTAIDDADISYNSTSFICSNYQTIDSVYRGNGTISCSIKNRVDIIDYGYSDATSFKTAMNGVQLCYELATPQTYQLTSTEVTLITGNNVIYTEAPNTLEVTYKIRS